MVFQDLWYAEDRRAPSPQVQEELVGRGAHGHSHPATAQGGGPRSYGLWSKGLATITWVPPAPVRRRPRGGADTRYWTLSSWVSPGSRLGAALVSMTSSMFTPRTLSTPATPWSDQDGLSYTGPLDCSEVQLHADPLVDYLGGLGPATGIRGGIPGHGLLAPQDFAGLIPRPSRDGSRMLFSVGELPRGW